MVNLFVSDWRTLTVPGVWFALGMCKQLFLHVNNRQKKNNGGQLHSANPIAISLLQGTSSYFSYPIEVGALWLSMLFTIHMLLLYNVLGQFEILASL
jgi:hypothetical protein